MRRMETSLGTNLEEEFSIQEEAAGPREGPTLGLMRTTEFRDFGFYPPSGELRLKSAIVDQTLEFGIK